MLICAVLLFVGIFQDCLVNAAPRTLPPVIIAGYPGSGYTTDGTPNEAVIAAAQSGVNVVIWNDIDLIPDPTTGNPSVQNFPPIACVAATVKALQAANLSTVHMVSAGGWGAPHPATSNPITGANYTAKQVYDAWYQWNLEIAQQYDWDGFDGIDWDLEGANAVSSPENVISAACLDIVGGFSQLAKADGFLVSLVPCESYFTPTTNLFSRSLLFPYSDWESRGVDFSYHGRNVYTYFIAKFGQTAVNNSLVLTFDFVTLGLYESYSHADFNITVLGQSASSYLTAIVPQYLEGWMVDFSSDPTVEWPSQVVQINQTQFVFGLANGWAGDQESVLIMPASVGEAWQALNAMGIQPRGAAYWCTSDEGLVPQGQTQPLFLAAGLNEFLHTRS